MTDIKGMKDLQYFSKPTRQEFDYETYANDGLESLESLSKDTNRISVTLHILTAVMAIQGILVALMTYHLTGGL